MLTLVLSDIHNRIDFIEPLIEKVAPDFTVFLGDYFDSKHDDSIEKTIATANWLKKSISYKNRWHLIGNHDAHYFFSENKSIRINGFTYPKLKAIRNILTTEEIDNYFNLVYFVGGYTLSHAGFHSELFDDIPTESDIAKLCDDALPMLKIGDIPKIVNYWPGWKNCLWPGCLMIHFSELDTIYNIKQLVGHSFHKEPIFNLYNICLDTKNEHYAIIENEKIEIYEI
jgi:hypothetical protein